MPNQEFRATILLMEEDKTMRTILQTHLQVVGYHVLTPDDGCEAVALLQRTCPDLVLTSIFMRCMNGLELIQDVRRTCPVTKIVAFFKTSGLHYGKIAQLAGADIALQKPISPTALLEIVEQQIGGEKSNQ